MGLLLLAIFAFPIAAAPGRMPFPRPAIPGGEAPPRPLDRRYSLWDGGTAPIEFPGDQAFRYSPSALPPANGSLPHLAASGDAVRPGGAELFVGVLAAADDQDQLKDALADLSQAGFHADARFPPVTAGRDGLKVFGWIPGARLGDAARLRSVRRLEIERAANRPASGAGSEIEVVVGVRRAAGLSEAEDDARFAQAMREISDEADFKWERTAGYQAIPGSSDAAVLVVGRLPARRLGRLMANPGVLKVQPFPGLAPEALAASTPPLGRVGRFLSYVAVQSPLLLAVTGLLLLPPLRPRLKRLRSSRD